jgi:hypothetical protein
MAKHTVAIDKNQMEKMGKARPLDFDLDLNWFCVAD